MITLNHENLNRLTKNLHTNCIALNKKQLKILDIDWPTKKGWVRELIGVVILDDTYEKLLKLRGKGSGQLNQITKKKLVLIREVENLGGKIIWEK